MNERKQIREAIKCLVLQPHSILFVNGEQIAPHIFAEAVQGLEFPWPTPVIIMRGGTDISLFTEDQLVAALSAIHNAETQFADTQSGGTIQ